MLKVVELSGGVGGARLARGLAQLAELDVTIVVNVGDDDDIHGLHVSPDLDTVIYTLAGMEGPQGWGRRRDSFITNTELGRLGADNRFKLGDLDLAMNLLRTEALNSGRTLSDFTSEMAKKLSIPASVVPATDDSVKTRITTDNGENLAFQEYFVIRQNQDVVAGIDFSGASSSHPAPGVIDAIRTADIVIVAPSNPPLSIWPILAIPGIREEVEQHQKVIAVSPLFGGKALKGPTDRVMDSLGLRAGNAGIAQAYQGIIDVLVVDKDDADDILTLSGVDVTTADTRIGDVEAAARFAEFLIDL